MIKLSQYLYVKGPYSLHHIGYALLRKFSSQTPTRCILRVSPSLSCYCPNYEGALNKQTKGHVSHQLLPLGEKAFGRPQPLHSQQKACIFTIKEEEARKIIFSGPKQNVQIPCHFIHFTYFPPYLISTYVVHSHSHITMCTIILSPFPFSIVC